MVFYQEALQAYERFASSLNPEYAMLLSTLILAFVILIYALFVRKFYHFIAHRDILKLNLSKYNSSNHPVFGKIFAVLLYLIEYILILPFIVFFWFAILAVILLTITKTQTATSIMVLSAAIVIAIRMISYYNEDLAEEIAKLLPLAVLAIAITDSSLFEPSRFINTLASGNIFFSQVLYFLGFIILVEFILRILSLVSFASQDDE